VQRQLNSRRVKLPESWEADFAKLPKTEPKQGAEVRWQRGGSPLGTRPVFVLLLSRVWQAGLCSSSGAIYQAKPSVNCRCLAACVLQALTLCIR
jgi:hypothetical protein